MTVTFHKNDSVVMKYTSGTDQESEIRMRRQHKDAQHKASIQEKKPFVFIKTEMMPPVAEMNIQNFGHYCVVRIWSHLFSGLDECLVNKESGHTQL